MCIINVISLNFLSTEIPFFDGLPLRGPNGELLGADGKPLHPENSNQDFTGNRPSVTKNATSVVQDRPQNETTGSTAEIVPVTETQLTDTAETDHFGGCD